VTLVVDVSPRECEYIVIKNYNNFADRQNKMADRVAINDIDWSTCIRRDNNKTVQSSSRSLCMRRCP